MIEAEVFRFLVASYLDPLSVIPVTVKVNVPRLLMRGELKLARPLELVMAEPVPVASPDHVPVTVARGFTAPF